MAELSNLLSARRVTRPWDVAPLHATDAPANFRAHGDWPSVVIGEAYMVGFFARCGAGPYGYTKATPSPDRTFLHALSRDRDDGPVVCLDGWAERLPPRRAADFRVSRSVLHAERSPRAGGTLARRRRARRTIRPHRSRDGA